MSFGFTSLIFSYQTDEGFIESILIIFIYTVVEFSI